jgi:glycosyltransferase involved in cell wall biosynthesis
MILTFVAPGAPYPIGGVTMIYEFAAAMADRGHEVHLFHYPVFRQSVAALEDVDWYSFPDGIDHHFPPVGFDPNTAPPSDIIFGFSSEDAMPAHLGLPVALVQGYRMVRPPYERRTFKAPCPKICIAKWLVGVGLELGVPRNELIHVPLGLRHERYRVTRPIAGRPPRVSFCYNPHPQKGAALALDVLETVKASTPALEVVIFGAGPPTHPIPEWMHYRENPSQDELVDEIYNGSRAFLCTSDVEGFGLPSIEAMACGAVLVTTDNGGSEDYAVPGVTALVTPTGDARGLVSALEGLLGDDRRRIELATAGRDYVERFDWGRTAELLEDFLERYLADPTAYGRPAVAG